MSKDRYSDDHTIEIVGGTNKLEVLGSIEVSDSIDIGEDLTVGNNLIVGGDITINNPISTSTINCQDIVSNLSLDIAVDDNLNIAVDSITTIESSKIVLDSNDIELTSTPLLSSSEVRYKNYSHCSFILSDETMRNHTAYYIFRDSDSWLYMSMPLNDLPDNCIINSFSIAYRAGHIDDDLHVNIIRRNLNSGTYDTMFTEQVSIANPVNVYRVSNNDSSLYSVIDYENNTYFIIVSMKCGDNSTTMRFYNLRISYETQSVGL
jgi:hypothetical protein